MMVRSFILMILLFPIMLRAQVVVKKEKDIVMLENGLVRAVFKQNGKQVSQQYFAKQGGTWNLVAEAFNPPAEFPSEANQLLNTSISRYRYLTAAATGIVSVGDNKTVIINGELNNVKIAQVVSLTANNYNFH